MTPERAQQPNMLEPANGRELVAACVAVGGSLNLEVRTEVYVGRRIWGPRRRIDIVMTERELRRSIGIECKFQGRRGTAEEKIPATIQDIRAWPIDGVVCFTGPGFSEHMRSFLIASGKAIELDDLETWLRLYFVL